MPAHSVDSGVIARNMYYIDWARPNSASCTICDLRKLVNKHWSFLRPSNQLNIAITIRSFFLTFVFFSFFHFCYLQQLFRSQNPNLASNTGVPPPGQPGGQPLPQTLPLPSQQYLAQQSAAYAAAAQQAAPYVINPGQDAAQYMGLIAAAGMPQYYGVAPWGVYPANLIPQQGTQPRRPLTPSQQAGENQPSYQVRKHTTFNFSLHSIVNNSTHLFCIHI